MEEKKICPICGKPTSYYMGNYRKDGLCREHALEKKQGNIYLCPTCGKWHNKDEQCPNEIKKQTINFWTTTTPKTDENDTTCLLCGAPSNGKHFCYACWNKYKDKSIDIRISHCNSVQILDEYGNKTKKTKDGRYVRSLSEKIILDYFFDNYIRVIYEKAIPYINDKGEEKELHPDFYLVDRDFYIEFNGMTNKAYTKKKDFVKKIYEEKGLKVEILETDDIDDIDRTMEKLLSKYPKITR